jgi:hypothetical protein
VSSTNGKVHHGHEGGVGMADTTRNMPGGKMAEPAGKRKPGEMPGGDMGGQAVSKAEAVKPARKTTTASRAGAQSRRGASKSAGAVSTAAKSTARKPAARKKGGGR